MATTMKDLARELKISHSTISLVLNGRDAGRVSPELAGRIRQLAHETGFRLNRAASDLRRRRSFALGVGLAYSNNVYHAELVSALHSEIVRRRYRPLFSFFNSPEEQKSATALLLSSNLDGIITMEPELLPDQLDIPAVGFFHDDPRFDAVLLDVARGMVITFRQLRALGYERVGCFYLDSGGGDRRFALFSELAGQHGMTVVPELCVNTATLYEEVATEHAFSRLGRLRRDCFPAAVLCHNDTVAIMLLRRLRECGLRVPEEIALVGQDNIFLAAQQTPSLTTIGYGTPAVVAEKLVDRVLKRIESPGLKRSVEKIPPELFLRESCPAVHIGK